MTVRSSRRGMLAAAALIVVPSLARAAPALPADDVLDKDLSALLIRLGAPRGDVTPFAREQVKRSLERILSKPTLAETYARKQQLWPAIARELAARGLPEEVGYMAWAESGFRGDAASAAGSRGVWQFMPATARRFGLTVNENVDERSDIAKETRAAAELLSQLFGDFGRDAPLLAFAAYNAGETAVRRILDGEAAKAGGGKPEHRDFFWLSERGLLPAEAAGYVPRILAAALIGSHPERYGLR